jgi:Tfp pilus assembly protein PilN
MRALNLATRPFRNEALPNLAFALSAVLVVAVTAKQALVVRALLPDKTSALHDEVKTLDAEVARLRAEGASLRAPAPSTAQLSRWSQIKDLVDQRTFSWTRLLARLEKVVPEGVRISSITPSVSRGEIRLGLSAQARSTEGGFELLKRLQQRPEFHGAVPVSVGESGAGGEGGKEFRYAMLYEPAAASAGSAPAATSDADADGSGAPGEEATP